MIFSPSRMGRLNRHALVRQLQRSGTASRADLARALGMSQPTAGKIADALIAQGVLEEVDDGEAGGNAKPGRPGRMLRLNCTQPKFLGLQLGLEETWLAELPLGGAEEDRWQGAFMVPRSHASPAQEWEGQLRRAADSLAVRNFLGVLISVPGVVDEPKGRVLFSPNVHWSEGVDFVGMIRRIWPVPVLVVHELVALAHGQLVMHPGCEDFLLVDFGEGIGGAVMVQGKPLAHPLPISGELGHTPVAGNRRPCGCGANGCLETLLSRRGMLESFGAAHPGQPVTWEGLQAHLAATGPEPWLLEALDAAARVIAGALNVLGVRQVVITGHLNDVPVAVWEHLAEGIRRGAMWERFGHVECLRAARHRTAGLAALGIDTFLVPADRREPASPAQFSRPARRAVPVN